jgi:hypothetical protein
MDRVCHPIFEASYNTGGVREQGTGYSTDFVNNNGPVPARNLLTWRFDID